MRIWEVYDTPSYEERRGGRGMSSSSYRGGYGGGSYNHHDSKESEAYQCGVEEGWRQAMEHTYGERNIHRSGMGLGREVYMRGDEFMPDEDMYDMRRRRDSRGRFM